MGNIGGTYTKRDKHQKNNLQTMRSFTFTTVATISCLALSSEAFITSPSFVGRSDCVPTELDACRRNAKKEKRKRNRENMRKFQKPGAGTTTRKSLSKKNSSNAEREREEQFMAKCFIPDSLLVDDSSAVIVGQTEEEEE